ncbi:MAG: hypothetical protein HOV81_29870 [Kofleriaceae bacterium]|nr:hypothetical protein [Kofleriaceae bacterium]
MTESAAPIAETDPNAAGSRAFANVELASTGTILVEEGTLRRIVKAHLGLRGAGLRVPHHHCFVVAKAELERHRELARFELAKVDVAALPNRVVLVTGDRTKVAARDPEALSHVWRLAFHARIHVALDDLIGNDILTLAGVRERVEQIGQAEFDEVRSVLHQENLAIPPVDERGVYVEFVALYLELTKFAPRAVEHTFPAMAASFGRVDKIIARDLDVAALLAASRPDHAPAKPLVVEEAPPDYVGTKRLDHAIGSARKAATRARAKGNLAKAAILSARAGDAAGVREHLDLLVARLAKALGDTSPATVAAVGEGSLTAGWADALFPLAMYAGTQESLRFNKGARLLADLQVACTYAEREVKVVDLVSWALSLGRRKVVRALPVTRDVRVAKRLHQASEKVAECELENAEERERLAAVMHAITDRADANLRASLRPKVEAALDAVGLEPHSLPERVAEKKLVDELLDRAVDVGRLALGDLRDAISKNDLKLPDLTLDELRGGDQLLRIDRIFQSSLDGVYRSGEAYLRFLQKASSIMFGTKVGRFLTRFALLPLLGAFAVVEGLQHMIGPLSKLLTGHEPEIATPATLWGGAAFLFLLLHVPLFRRAVVFVLRWVWRIVKLILFDAPAALWRTPIVRRILDSRFNRWIVRPAIPAAIVAFAIHVEPRPDRYTWPIVGGVFVFCALVFNSRFGRLVEERFADWVILSSRQLTTRFLPGLVRYILELFGKLADLVDRAMYRVDEMLRFRSGQSMIKLVGKGILSAIWFVIAYVLRLYVDLFIEPSTNPIKHFPVVTVAAKILIPFTPAILSGVAGPASKLMGPAIGNSFAAFTVIVLPGLAGFLVWELKENWKLYRATRSKTLGPIAIGHHGESMIGFLKPGFHSGTIPKLFTKLRRAAWRDDEGGVAKQHEGLHHVEEAIEKFADRQLVSMLVEVDAFRARDVTLERIDIGSNRVQITLACTRLSPSPVVIRFELQSGWIVASLVEPGWTERLDDIQRRIFETALAGFYKLSGVAIVREQLEEALRDDDGSSPPYDISDDGLVVWPDGDFDVELVYDLRNLQAGKHIPTVRGDAASYHGALIDLAGRHALFGREPLYWSVWSTTWQQIQRGEEPMKIIVGPSLLRQRKLP